MRSPAKLTAAVLMGLHLVLVLHGSTRHSAVFDEVVYPTSGYAYLTTGDYRMNPEHPPFLKLWTGLAWLGTGLRATETPGWEEGDPWQYGMSMIYGRGSPHALLLFRARTMIAMLSLVLGAVLFFVAREMGGDAAGVVAVALYALDPLVIAHAGFATTDLGCAAFLFIAAVSFPKAVLDGNRPPVLASGGLLGLALASKLSTLPLLLVLLLVAAMGTWAHSRRSRQGRARKSRSRAPMDRIPAHEEPRALWFRAAAVCGIAVLVITVCYGPAGPLLYLKAARTLQIHSEIGHPAYAFGAYSSSGWWWFFPAAWIVKTPIPVLILSLTGVFVLFSRIRSEAVSTSVLLLTPALVVIGAMTGSIDLGVRHLLPATPFLALAGGLCAARVWAWGRPGRGAVLGLLLWLLVGTLRVHPDETAYANEVLGGPDRLWHHLADSNVDWGQDLPALAAEVHEYPLRRLYLAYFGTADPAAYGLPYHCLPAMRMIDRRFEDGPDPTGREWIAISVTKLLDVYTEGHEAYAWLRERPMSAFPGHSIALYDITGDAEAHRMLGETAFRFRDDEAAEPPLRRALELAPGSGVARLDLARVLARRGLHDEAVEQCTQGERLSPSPEAHDLCRGIRSARP